VSLSWEENLPIIPVSLKGLSIIVCSMLGLAKDHMYLLSRSCPSRVVENAAYHLVDREFFCDQTMGFLHYLPALFFMVKVELDGISEVFDMFRDQMTARHKWFDVDHRLGHHERLVCRAEEEAQTKEIVRGTKDVQDYPSPVEKPSSLLTVQIRLDRQPNPATPQILSDLL
jgi:hypothetical protein